MLSIAKVADADYYLKAVASGIEDYYAIGEGPGRWTAHTHELLGIDGELEPAQLTAVLAGRHPLTHEPLIESANRKIPHSTSPSEHPSPSRSPSPSAHPR